MNLGYLDEDECVKGNHDCYQNDCWNTFGGYLCISTSLWILIESIDELNTELSGEYKFHSLRNQSPVWERNGTYLAYQILFSGWLIQQKNSFLKEIFDGYFMHSKGDSFHNDFFKDQRHHNVIKKIPIRCNYLITGLNIIMKKCFEKQQSRFLMTWMNTTATKKV